MLYYIVSKLDCETSHEVYIVPAIDRLNKGKKRKEKKSSMRGKVKAFRVPISTYLSPYLPICGI